MSLFFSRCLIFFSLWLLGLNASAQTISDSNTGFSVNVDFSKTTACVVYPHKSYDADVCPIDNYVFPTEDASMIARGVIRFEPGEMLFNIAHIKAPFTAPMSQKEAEIFIGKYLELFNAYESETLDSGMVLVNDQPFYRYYGDVGSDTALPYSRILFYAFSGKGYHYFISFNFDATQEKKAFEVSDHILRTIKVPLPEHSEEGELLYQLSYEVIFAASLFIGLFLLLSFLSYVFQRWLPKKEGQSVFRGKGPLALEGITRFIALSTLIVGIYEITVAFRTWDAVGNFLVLYGIVFSVFIVLRLIWRWVSEKWLKPFPKADQNSNALFFPIGIPKLIVLSIFTFGLYSFYWFYKNWKYVQSTTDEQINPVLKSIFYPVCAYFLFRRIRNYAKESGSNLSLHAGFWATILGLCYLIDMVPLGNLIPQWSLAVLGLLMFFLEFAVLIPVQTVINQLNSRFAPTVDLNQRLKPIDAVVCVIGSVILAVIIYILYASWSLPA